MVDSYIDKLAERDDDAGVNASANVVALDILVVVVAAVAASYVDPQLW